MIFVHLFIGEQTKAKTMDIKDAVNRIFSDRCLFKEGCVESNGTVHVSDAEIKRIYGTVHFKCSLMILILS
jgi:hypothetical protein